MVGCLLYQMERVLDSRTKSFFYGVAAKKIGYRSDILLIPCDRITQYNIYLYNKFLYLYWVQMSLSSHESVGISPPICIFCAPLTCSVQLENLWTKFEMEGMQEKKWEGSWIPFLMHGKKMHKIWDVVLSFLLIRGKSWGIVPYSYICRITNTEVHVMNSLYPLSCLFLIKIKAMFQ